MQGVTLITVTHVRITGDLRQAHALFTVHDAGEAELQHVREGLNHASGYFRHAIARRLRLKITPTLTFEIDRVFEKAARVEHLLQELAGAAVPAAPVAEAGADVPAVAASPPDQDK